MIKLELDDSRRLTGKGLMWDHHGAVMDVLVEGIDKTKVVQCWQHHIQSLLKIVGWQNENITARIFENGASLAISAPFDALYAATEINETAWTLTCDELTGHFEPIDDERIEELRQMIADEVNPNLLALIEQAQKHNVPWLTDDDAFSLGFGATAEVWEVDCLPDVSEVDWSKYKSVPVAMITGTNGKSTSVRLSSEIFKHAGKCCGVTSTDFIRVGEKIIDKGDYSGPGGARMLLRDNAVDVALLEVARGGILRRGLPIPQVDAALITNIAEDHLGQYGINTIEGLTATKFVVAKAVSDKGTLILNADDSQIVEYAKQINKNKCWFSTDENNPVLQQHHADGGAICFVRDGVMVYQDAVSTHEVVSVNDVPMCFHGAAIHNVQNSLGAIALAKSLGVADDHIQSALCHFRSDAQDNPGRGNVFDIKGAKVIMDFAHNEHSMKAMVTTMSNMMAKRKWLMLSAAGDRSDHDISVMTEAAMAMAPDCMVAVELEDYLRGREVGEIPDLMQKVAKNFSFKPVEFHVSPDPLAGVKLIVERLQPGDLVLLLVLSDRDKVLTYLNGLG